MSNIYYINSESQFIIKNESICGLTNETLTQLKSLSEDDQIFFDINNISKVTSILPLFNELDKDENLFDKISKQCSGILIHDMPDLIFIDKAFEGVGDEYEDEFCFEIYKCPKLKFILNEAFSQVAYRANTIIDSTKCLEYTLSFESCPNLEDIGNGSFSHFGFSTQNVIGISFLGCSNLKTISKCAFEKAFCSSPYFMSINFEETTSLNKIHKYAFYDCGNAGNKVTLKFSSSSIKQIHKYAFYDIGNYLIFDLKYTNELVQIQDNAFDGDKTMFNIPYNELKKTIVEEFEEQCSESENESSENDV